MVRHLGSALTDVTYVFDEPTAGLHPHDIQRMNTLLLSLRDKGNTVLVVEHKPEVIAIADHVVDLGPGAGKHGGRVEFTGTVEALRASDTLTGQAPRPPGPLRASPRGLARAPWRSAAPVSTTCAAWTWTFPPGSSPSSQGWRARARRRSFTATWVAARASWSSTRARSRARAAPIPRPTRACSTSSARTSPRPTASSPRSSAPIPKAHAPRARAPDSSSPTWARWRR